MLSSTHNTYAPALLHCVRALFVSVDLLLVASSLAVNLPGLHSY